MRVAIIMGSQTDYEVMKQAAEVLTDFKIPFHLEIVSAHRTPEKMMEFAKSARDQGFNLIIAGAGGAAHLPGMVAAMTTLPVIGVPINVNSLDGMDALLSIVQMPRGIPVATVAIDNAANAGILAARILGIQNPQVQEALDRFQKDQALKVQKMNQEIQK